MKEIKFLSNLKIGSLELGRFQTLVNNNLRNFVEPMFAQVGLLLPKDFAGAMPNDWLVTAAGLQSIQINTGKAVILDENGELDAVTLESAAVVSTPDVDGTYKVLLRQFYTTIEQGTVSLANGSQTVIGTNTLFTQLFALNRRIIIDSTAYVVTAVTDDTHLTISALYTGASITSANFAVGGWFSSYPVGIESNYIYQNYGLSIIISATQGANDLYLADVVISTGVIETITDKRSTNLCKIYSETTKLDSTNIRTRKITLYRPQLLNAGTVNANITQPQAAQILANDSHIGTMDPKLTLTFYKEADDKLITVSFSSWYTDTGLPISVPDQSKWEVCIGLYGLANGAAVNLAQTLVTYDISALSIGYYELSFKLSKISTAFNLSIKVNEIYLTGNKFLVVEG
ncbi:MAG: hypothetical protein RDU14_16795 [Melioribacteraceae bacterium]|nr:hypothetical protein [Melioribacteraceae bacterium]